MLRLLNSFWRDFPVKKSRAAMRHLAEVAFIDDIKDDFFESLRTKEEVDEAEANLADFLIKVSQRENNEPGEALAIFRAERRLTQAQMASMMGVSRRTFQNYEGGKQEISIGPLIKLFARYDLDLNELLSGDPIEPSKEYDLNIVQWTLDVRQIVQSITRDRGIRDHFIDDVVADFARTGSQVKKFEKVKVVDFVESWIEQDAIQGPGKANSNADKPFSKKRKKHRRGFNLPKLSATGDAASYPRRRRNKP